MRSSSLARLTMASVLVMTGCVNPEAKRLYEEGTEALTENRVDVCIDRLEQARALMPDTSSFIRNNLAICYYRAGRRQEGWFEVRQAVMMNPSNDNAKAHFELRWQEFVDAGVLAIGTSRERVRSVLGEPDVLAVARGKGDETWIYAIRILGFRGGALASIK